MPSKLRRVLPHGVMLAVSCWLYWAATRIDVETGGRIGPAVWPKAVIVLMGLLCLYEIVKRLVGRAELDARGLLADAKVEETAAPDNHRMLFSGIALVAAYVAAVPWAGFFVTTAIFLALFPLVGGFRRPALCLAIGVGGALALVIVFMRVAYISLPLGEGVFRTVSLALLRALGVT
jgi:putative tricarboxylic transport membrane protein